MVLMKIARMGHPVLRQAATDVPDPGAPDIRRLAADMIETMIDAPGIGLAAPQVHVPLRLIVIRVPWERTSGEPGDTPIEETVLVNPRYEPDDEEQVAGFEGCLSIPGLRGEVWRWRRIRYTALDLDGRMIERTAVGMHARVVQHEVDHLDGVLYIDRMRDLKRLAFIDELRHMDEA